MPRPVRNFWASVEQPKREVATGGDAISVHIYMRDNGLVTLPIRIEGTQVGDSLRLDVNVHGSNVFSITTDR